MSIFELLALKSYHLPSAVILIVLYHKFFSRLGTERAKLCSNFFSKQTIHYQYSNISFPSNYMNVYWYFSFWLVTRREMPKKLDILFRQITTIIKVCVVFVFRLQTLMDFSKIYRLKASVVSIH